MSHSPRILLVDSYDSFTNNLSALLSRCTGATVHTIHNDAPYRTITSLLPYLACFDAVVVGPGPGTPEISSDVGLVRDLWHLSEQHLLPIFGVCLGLQSLCYESGASIRRLGTVKHGLTSDILHCGRDLFDGAGEITAVRYHSLYVQLRGDECSQLDPLAWADDKENGQVLMAVRHIQKPFWAVQYHPESICTGANSDRVIHNFWKLAQEWNHQHSRQVTPLPSTWSVPPREPSLLERQQGCSEARAACGLKETSALKSVQTRSLFAHGLSVTSICEVLGADRQQDFVLLDSAAAPGRWSIIGIVSPEITQLIKYTVGDDHVVLSRAGERSSKYADKANLDRYGGSVWRYLASYMEEKRALDGPEDSPFWGGLVGYFSYELGVSSLSIPLRNDRKQRPDINLAFVERCVVVDTHTGQIYIHSLLPQDSQWLDNIKLLIQRKANMPITPCATPPPGLFSKSAKIQKPAKDDYTALVSTAQEYLAAGDSYELCLTARTRISLANPVPAWNLYSCLRQRNPAPYAAYIRLQGVSLLSSSPERFISYSRSGHVQLRPIKGTVKKTPTTTFDSASTILNTPKERAENLMIVDLIRHDLSLILPHVHVPKLMVVEEYHTVYQLVSVIEGNLPKTHTGFDVLAASLPPGSMTGAPKKRSVEILEKLEEGMEERGVYSGIAGYWSVCGAGDWSVVIRSAVRYDDEGEGEWVVGAGGAVTALSDPVAEWDEMRVKADSTVSAFLG